MSDADAIVIGAGFAGLMAAKKLTEAGIATVVLEARDRVGGRVVNQDIGDGNVVEMGGQWIGPTQDRIAGLAQSLGVQTFPTYETGHAIAFIDGKAHRFKGEIPRINPIVLADFGWAQLKLDRLAKHVPIEAPWTAAKAGDWDSQTFESWIRRNVRTRNGRVMWEAIVNAVFATEPVNFSLLHALFYFRSGTNIDTLVRTTGGAQQDRFVGGSQLVALRLAEQLGAPIEYQAPVRSITQRGSTVEVDAGRAKVTAKRVIVAIPPVLAGRIQYEPLMPPRRDQLTQRTPAGSVIKANVVYDEPFWRNENLKGQAFNPQMPVSMTFDNSPPGGSPGVLVGFFEGNQAREFSETEPEIRQKAAIDSLVSYFGKRAASPEAYFDLDWSAEIFTRGCYGAHMPPGVWTQYGGALKEPVGLIHWAGTETAVRWSGYIDGALESGERAAAEVLSALGG